LLAILALIMALIFWKPLYDAALVRFHDMLSLEDLTLKHLSYRRWQGWTAAIGMLRERPILGVGLGNFLDYAPRFIRPSSPGGGLPPEYMANAHNLFLDIASQLGLVGLVILLLFLGMLLFELMRGLSEVRGSKLEAIGWGLLGVYVAHIVLSITGHGFWSAKLSIGLNVLLWTLFALMTRLRLVGNKMKSGAITEDR